MSQCPPKTESVQITLNKSEVQQIIKLAAQRYSENRKAGNPEIKMSKAPEGSTAHEVVGLAGEMAVLKYLGFPEQTHTYSYKQKDFTLIKADIYDVGELEVRSTHYNSGCLVFQTKDLRKNPDLPYILCTIAKPCPQGRIVVTLRGWSTPKRGCTPDRVRTVYTTSWYVEQKHLSSLNTLPAFYFYNPESLVSA